MRLAFDDELGLEKRLDDLLERIAARQTLTDAEPELDELDRLQQELARAAFKWSTQLPNRLRQFVREFDKPDDDVRTEVFLKIRSGTFLRSRSLF